MHRFNFDTDTSVNGLNYFRNADHIDFSISQGNTTAGGYGATRQVYSEISNKLISDGVLLQRSYFADINLDHAFWKDPTSVQTFCNFVRSTIRCNCKLPFHLPPAVLEAIASKPMRMSDLGFYANKIDPAVAKTIAKCNIKNTGYDSKEEAYRAVCMWNHNRLHKEIGERLRRVIVSRHRKKTQVSFKQIDETFSGPYRLTTKLVLSMMTIYGDLTEQRMFREFIESMTEPELRAMLLTFGSTLSLNSHYNVYIADIKPHINISVCTDTVQLSRELFVDSATLQNLKMYFVQADNKISDGMHLPNPDQSRMGDRFLTAVMILLVIVLAWLVIHEYIIPVVDSICEQIASTDKPVKADRLIQPDIFQAKRHIRIDRIIMRLLGKRIDDETTE